MTKLDYIAPCLALGVLVATAGCGSDGSNTTDAGGGDGTDVLPPFTNGVSTLSGAAEPGDVDGPRGTARFANPVNAALGPDGKLYVADFDNGKLRQVDPETGATSTVVDQSGFSRPFGLAFVGNTLFVGTDRNSRGIGDANSGTIWRVSITGKSAQVVAENIGRARGMAALTDGRIAFTDYQSHTVNLLDTGTGAVTVLAGTKGQQGYADGSGAAARFAQPYHLAQRGDGSLVVADYENNRLRIVGLDGSVQTFAGSGAAGFQDGAMTAAQFFHPQGVAIATNGDIYVTDADNFRVRRIRGQSVTTVAGNGQAGHVDADDPLQAQLHGLEGLGLRPDGSMLFVADGGRGEDVPHNYIRSVKVP